MHHDVGSTLGLEAQALVEEIAALTPAEVVATCDAAGIGEIVAELGGDARWMATLPALARATRSYVRMRRASVNALLAGRIKSRCTCPVRRARLSRVHASAEAEYLARHDAYERELTALVEVRDRIAVNRSGGLVS